MSKTYDVAVLGAGVMGIGIAQIAAQAGSTVHLFDKQAGAAQAAQTALLDVWDKLVAKGRLTPETRETYASRLHAAGQLADLAVCDLVVEAVVERRRQARRSRFAK